MNGTLQRPSYTTSASQKTLLPSPAVLPPYKGTEPGSDSLAGGRGTASMTLLYSVSDLCPDPRLMLLQLGPRSTIIHLGHSTASPKLAPPHLQVPLDPFEKVLPNPFSPVPFLGTVTARTVRPKVKYSSRHHWKLVCSWQAELW